MQTLFFWFIASESIGNIVKDKSILIKNMASGIPEIKKLIEDYLDSAEFEMEYYRGIEEKKIRYENNVKLMWKWMLPPFVIISILLGLSILTEIYCICNKIRPRYRFDKIDALILTSVFGAFTTEVIFYLIVISRSRLLSDIDIFEVFLKSSEINLMDVLVEIFKSYDTLTPSSATFPPFGI